MLHPPLRACRSFPCLYAFSVANIALTTYSSLVYQLHGPGKIIINTNVSSLNIRDPVPLVHARRPNLVLA